MSYIPPDQFGERPGDGRKLGGADMPVPYTQQQLDAIRENRLHRKIFKSILLLIDWLNRLAGAEKPKKKTGDQQMATLNELFNIVEDEDVPDDEIWMTSHDGSDSVKLINIGKPERPEAPPPESTLKV